jgi:hypothetical protein
MFAKSLAMFSAASLIYFAISPATLLSLAKYLALSLGASILLSLAYPYVRGIRAGDSVLVITHSDMAGGIKVRLATALAAAKLNGKIRLSLEPGSEIEGIVKSYEGFFAPAKVNLEDDGIKVI